MTRSFILDHDPMSRVKSRDASASKISQSLRRQASQVQGVPKNALQEIDTQKSGFKGSQLKCAGVSLFFWWFPKQSVAHVHWGALKYQKVFRIPFSLDICCIYNRQILNF